MGIIIDITIKMIATGGKRCPLYWLKNECVWGLGHFRIQYPTDGWYQAKNRQEPHDNADNHN